MAKKISPKSSKSYEELLPGELKIKKGATPKYYLCLQKREYFFKPCTCCNGKKSSRLTPK